MNRIYYLTRSTHGDYSLFCDEPTLDDDGYYTVLINLYDDFDLFNKLSVGEQLELNSEIFDYIDTKSEVIPSNYKLKVKFIGRKLKQKDKEIVEYIAIRSKHDILLS